MKTRQQKKYLKKWSCVNCGCNDMRIMSPIIDNDKYTIYRHYCTKCLTMGYKLFDLSVKKTDKEVLRDILTKSKRRLKNAKSKR